LTILDRNCRCPEAKHGHILADIPKIKITMRLRNSFPLRLH